MNRIILGITLIIITLGSDISFAEQFCDKPKVSNVEVVDKTQDTVYLNISICAKAGKTYVAMPRLTLNEQSFKTDIVGLQLNDENKLIDYPLLRPAESEDAFSTDSLTIDLVDFDSKERAVLTHPLKLDWVAINEISEPSYHFLEHLYQYITYLIDYNGSKYYKKAKRLIDYSLAKDPNFVDTYHELARYLMKTQGFGTNSPGVLQAEQVLLTARDINPEHANTRVLLGYVYSWENRFEEALKEFEKAEEIGTDNLWLYTNWGQMYERKGKTKKAIKYYRKAVSDPKPQNSYDRGMLFGYRYLSSLYLSEKMYKEASKMNAEASKKFDEKECFEAKMQLIDALYLDKYEQVLNQLELSPSRYCKSTYKELKVVANIRMWNSLSKKNKGEAELYYRKATVLNPDYVELLATVAQYEFSVNEGVLENFKTNKRGLDVTDADDRSALVKAILSNDIESVERLINAGASVSKSYTEQKLTALIIAVAYNNLELVKLLVKEGANINHKIANGMSAIDIARSNGFNKVAKYLDSSRST
ncbi:ankyrin repeat domain-containing protein [Kangiella shandongensis]|uniref:ankyrin repeat domain-containing protein n=1 Tax=Kangiella shandongensis TaxID=2763258 RepID=UPI001CBD586E|nr:ankyrin repeat domain-containing protein [Kangiella shandongensis]